MKTDQMPELDGKALYALSALIYGPDFMPLTEGELGSIKAFVAKRCKKFDPVRELRLFVLKHPAVPAVAGIVGIVERDWRKAAAKPGGISRSKEAGATIDFVYVSLHGLRPEDAWRATLSLPASPTHETQMELKVSDRAGNPECGVFKVAGVEVKLFNGKGVVAYGDFVKGVKDGMVSLTRQGGRPVPGTLTLV